MPLNPLEKIIKKEALSGNGLTLARFMDLALAHPKHGYYMKKDPLGRAGDFITAPEVSQLFGEILGVWAADLWMKMGAPECFTLLECGPGRGTLMSDLSRATKNIKGFHEAAQIHLLEISPVLKNKQAETLRGYNPRWHNSLETLPEGQPIIVIANEFLDALPVHQLQKDSQGDWREVNVIWDDKNGFEYALKEADKNLINNLPFHIQNASPGRVFEIAPVRSRFVENLGALLQKNTGGVLFIDYGHTRSGVGDTFQALKNNAYANPLEHIGEADLTSHVDFEALVHAAQGMDLNVCGPIGQGTFLRNLGINLRARMLLQSADAQQAEMLEKGLHRLIYSRQMGELFKVLYIGSTHEPDGQNQPAGFV
ncbi:MAG: SAM-dependent methyltransferase [Alphaproteobacteria bacterium]|nr:SAM-dependent methyltransferase [Alphaproteobacteria bacterium]